MVLISKSDRESEVTEISMISPMMEVCGASTGFSTFSGSCEAIMESFSLTICLALYISVPQSNSTQMMDMPKDEVERTRRTSVAPFIAVSIGNDTSFSTSSAAMPWASIRITTVGAVRSGKTSTCTRVAV